MDHFTFLYLVLYFHVCPSAENDTKKWYGQRNKSKVRYQTGCCNVVERDCWIVTYLTVNGLNLVVIILAVPALDGGFLSTRMNIGQEFLHTRWTKN